MDTVKRQLMLDGCKGFQAQYNNSIFFCIRTIYAKNGIQGFYRGCLLNALKAAPVAAIAFYMNDFLRRSMGFEKKW
jgi:hypothetical protein